MNDRYQHLAPIAEGGLGTVFRAWDAEAGRMVAIKRIRKDKTADFDVAVKALFREAGHQAAVRHPNIVTVYDVGVDAEGGYLVMELVEGEPLESVIMREALGREDFDCLVRQTLAGMQAVHDRGLLHLDLKPGNLIVQKRAEGGLKVKIIDFGLAGTAGQTERVCGSVYFMAPEQFEDGPVDARTDLYALGCVFYHALTQRYPFDGEMAPQVIVAHLYHRRQPLAELRPDLPGPLVQWVEWLMSRAATERPASADEALQAYPQASE